MEPITLISTALTLATPFLLKTGESIAEKVGEDIWNFIKKPFLKNDESLSTFNIENDDEKANLISVLLAELEKDESFKQQLENVVQKGQNDLKAFQQNINNNGSIEKQINIQSNSGKIQM